MSYIQSFLSSSIQLHISWILILAVLYIVIHQYRHKPLNRIIDIYLKEGRAPFNLTQLLNFLEQSPSMVDRIISITLKARFNIPHWDIALRKQMETNEEIFHHFAYELLET